MLWQPESPESGWISNSKLHLCEELERADGHYLWPCRPAQAQLQLDELSDAHLDSTQTGSCHYVNIHSIKCNVMSERQIIQALEHDENIQTVFGIPLL